MRIVEKADIYREYGTFECGIVVYELEGDRFLGRIGKSVLQRRLSISRLEKVVEIKLSTFPLYDEALFGSCVDDEEKSRAS